MRLREPRLRWPVDTALPARLSDMSIRSVGRRGKYLLIDCAGPREAGWLIVHLGMSGSVRFVDPGTPFAVAVDNSLAEEAIADGS